jgi:hypothetical protein
MLNSHPDLFVFNETHWIPKLYEFFGTSKIETGLMLDIVRRTHHVTGLPTAELDDQAFLNHSNPPICMTVAEFCDALGDYFATQDGKSQWADKTPDYGFFAAQLQVYWPDCRIIHLIRDGAAVVNSMSRHIGYKALVAARQFTWCPLSLDYVGCPDGYPPQPVQAFAELWYRRLLRTRDEAVRLQPGTYLEVRHEDILRAPVAELRRIAKFTDLRAADDWLANSATLIDAGRTRKARPIEVLRDFTAEQVRLLQNLGYAVSPE